MLPSGAAPKSTGAEAELAGKNVLSPIVEFPFGFGAKAMPLPRCLFGRRWGAENQRRASRDHALVLLNDFGHSVAADGAGAVFHGMTSSTNKD